MRIAGILAEYNPFHKGHAHHIDRTRDVNGAAATHIVAVMSGDFVQRGAPALLPKEGRVQAFWCWSCPGRGTWPRQSDSPLAVSVSWTHWAVWMCSALAVNAVTSHN